MVDVPERQSFQKEQVGKMKYSDFFEKHNFTVTALEPMRKEYKGITYKELYVILDALEEQGYKDVKVTESDNTIESR